MDLSKLLDDRLVPRSAGARETMLVTGKSVTKFTRNGLILASIRKRTSAGRTAGPRSVTPGQNYVVRTGPSTCRKMTFLELYVAKYRFNRRMVGCKVSLQPFVPRYQI